MTESGVWRSGEQLVMRRGAELPYMCVKTNTPASQRIMVRLRAQWNPIFWGLIYLLFAKRISVDIPLSQGVLDKNARRRHIYKWMTIGGCVALPVVIGLGVLCFEVLKVSAHGPGPMILAFMCMGAILVGTGGGFLWSWSRSFGVEAQRITKTHAWLSGISKEYLSALPEWPSKE